MAKISVADAQALLKPFQAALEGLGQALDKAAEVEAFEGRAAGRQAEAEKRIAQAALWVEIGRASCRERV